MISPTRSYTIFYNPLRFLCSILTVFTCFCFILSNYCRAQDWMRIGLDGIQVTAITCGVNFGQDSVIAAGTKDSGVYRYTWSVSVKPDKCGFMHPLRFNTTKSLILVCNNNTIKNPLPARAVLYLPNGKKAAALAPNGIVCDLHSGVYIMKPE